MFIFKLYYNNEKCPKCGFKLSFNQNLSLNLNDRCIFISHYWSYDLILIP